ncbi:MAG: hypothetical protein DI588_06240 [Flavobacterium johnsoniae]|nr:MAG: hypothetical protein DI588_06240 [Flavobacterium johnsoniae]
MKSKLLLLSFLSLSVLIGCKDDKKEPVEKVVEVEKPSKTFDVIIDATIKKDDKIMVYYQDETIPWFNDEHFVETGVVGMPDEQKVKISVPEEYIPHNIRIDISSVAGQEPIVLKKITLKYLDKSFVIESAYLKNYFTMNDYIKYDANTNTMSFIKKEDGSYDPVMLTTEPLIAEIIKITK